MTRKKIEREKQKKWTVVPSSLFRRRRCEFCEKREWHLVVLLLFPTFPRETRNVVSVWYACFLSSLLPFSRDCFLFSWITREDLGIPGANATLFADSRPLGTVNLRHNSGDVEARPRDRESVTSVQSGSLTGVSFLYDLLTFDRQPSFTERIKGWWNKEISTPLTLFLPADR